MIFDVDRDAVWLRIIYSYDLKRIVKPCHLMLRVLKYREQNDCKRWEVGGLGVKCYPQAWYSQWVMVVQMPSVSVIGLHKMDHINSKLWIAMGLMEPCFSLLSYWLLMASREGTVIVSSCVPRGAPQNPRDSLHPWTYKWSWLNSGNLKKDRNIRKWWPERGSNRGWGTRDGVVYSDHNVLYIHRDETVKECNQ